MLYPIQFAYFVNFSDALLKNKLFLLILLLPDTQELINAYQNIGEGLWNAQYELKLLANKH